TNSSPPVTSTLSLHDALPIFYQQANTTGPFGGGNNEVIHQDGDRTGAPIPVTSRALQVANGQLDHYYANVTIQGTRWREYVQFRSEEHTSELQSRFDLVCRLL